MQTRRKKRGQEQSPYKAKVPYQYSSEYRSWRAAMKSQDAARIEEADQAYRNKFLRGEHHVLSGHDTDTPVASSHHPVPQPRIVASLHVGRG